MLRSASAHRPLLQARYAFAVAQLEVRRLILLRARKRYNPNQPRVPAGNPDGGQWTSEGGWGSGEPRAEPASMRPRGGGGTRVIGGRVYQTTPAQEARLDVSAAQARALIREVQRHDPNWRPRPSIYEGVEGAIRANESDAAQAAARLRELGARAPSPRPLYEILMPGGEPVGRREGRASGGTRTVGRSEFDKLLEALGPNAEIVSSPRSYEGLWFRRPDGSIFGVRRSEVNGTTIDVIRSNHPSIDNGDKVHRK